MRLTGKKNTLKSPLKSSIVRVILKGDFQHYLITNLLCLPNAFCIYITVCTFLSTYIPMQCKSLMVQYKRFDKCTRAARELQEYASQRKFLLRQINMVNNNNNNNQKILKPCKVQRITKEPCPDNILSYCLPSNHRSKCTWIQLKRFYLGQQAVFYALQAGFETMQTRFTSLELLNYMALCMAVYSIRLLGAYVCICT